MIRRLKVRTIVCIVLECAVCAVCVVGVCVSPLTSSFQADVMKHLPPKRRTEVRVEIAKKVSDAMKRVRAHTQTHTHITHTRVTTLVAYAQCTTHIHTALASSRVFASDLLHPGRFKRRRSWRG